MKDFERLFGLIWNPAYDDGDGDGDGDGGAGDGDGGAGDGDGGAGDGNGGAGDGDGGAGDGDGGAGDGDGASSGKKTFNQTEVNTILAKERRKNQGLTQKAIEELNALKSKATITNEERKELDTRIESLSNELLTKKELARKNDAKTKKEHEKAVGVLTGERDEWKNRYTESTINRSITDAAAENKSYSPRQIVAILRPNTHLNEVKNADGESNGEFEVKVDFNDTDEKGKPVKLILTVPEAVKRMREIEEYQNLFQGEGAGGLGSINRSQGGDEPTLADAAKEGPEAYRKARKEGLI